MAGRPSRRNSLHDHNYSRGAPLRVLRLPDGKRKKDLTGKIEEVLDLFNGRTLAFDVEASEQLAQILARTERVGQKPPVPDAYIAAIAAAKRFAVATQNVNHFQSIGIPLINPWK